MPRPRPKAGARRPQPYPWLLWDFTKAKCKKKSEQFQMKGSDFSLQCWQLGRLESPFLDVYGSYSVDILSKAARLTGLPFALRLDK